ncbi:branched-chain amino acid ABC transporter permease [Duganella sp. FT92W]|uniref:Branched-chain amino acid ABC transporter permease n=1 Tax=Pseudoduganella rivuli TaxID=2666085 RepID=A0A7X2LPN8_9BURK|nr:branched-chain amino acid ABC transporter permease [Pseudoduganella rivuli]MRV70485.1 branched-chain amino acid ABC transporter permease [Pseudoduganella rivuli]
MTHPVHSPAAGLVRTRAPWLALAAATGVTLAALPWYADFSQLRLLVEMLTVLTMALAWNLLAGYGGLVAVGQHVFVGVGAYCLFVLSNRLQLNPWLVLPLSTALTVGFAWACAWPMFRLSGAYFAVGSWVLAEMLRILAQNSETLGAGAGMPLETMGDVDRWTRNAGVYWAALAVGIAALLVVRGVLRGRLGLALMSVRDGEVAATACGVAVARTKLQVWLIAAAMSGAAGAVAYMNTLQVSPDASFSLNWTAAAIFISVLGGIGTFEGPLLGTALYFLLRQYFSEYGTGYLIGTGLLAIVTMMYLPGGLWSFFTRRWRLDPFRLRHRAPPPPSR